MVLAIACSIATDGKRSACLELYSQNTGLFVASVKMGKVTLSRRSRHDAGLNGMLSKVLQLG